jgi:hypothetical protein
LAFGLRFEDPKFKAKAEDQSPQTNPAIFKKQFARGSFYLSSQNQIEENTR